MIDYELIGERFKQLRLKRGWSVMQAARIAGMHDRMLSHIENGAYQDYKLLTHIVPLCKAYKCSVQLFIASVEE